MNKESPFFSKNNSTHLDLSTAKLISKNWLPATHVFNENGGYVANGEEIMDFRCYKSCSFDALTHLAPFEYGFAYFEFAYLDPTVARALSDWKVHFLCFKLKTINAEAAHELGENRDNSHAICIDKLEQIDDAAARGLVRATGKDGILHLGGTFDLEANTACELAKHSHELNLLLQGEALGTEAARHLAFHLGYRLDIVSNYPFSKEVQSAFSANPNKALTITRLEHLDITSVGEARWELRFEDCVAHENL